MSRPVSLAIEETHSALAMLRKVLAERIHAADRIEIDQLVDRAQRALDKASSELLVAREDAQRALDRM